jgi:hypothetical protein
VPTVVSAVTCVTCMANVTAHPSTALSGFRLGYVGCLSVLHRCLHAMAGQPICDLQTVQHTYITHMQLLRYVSQRKAGNGGGIGTSVTAASDGFTNCRILDELQCFPYAGDDGSLTAAACRSRASRLRSLRTSVKRCAWPGVGCQRHNTRQGGPRPTANAKLGRGQAPTTPSAIPLGRAARRPVEVPGGGAPRTQAACRRQPPRRGPREPPLLQLAETS